VTDNMSSALEDAPQLCEAMDWGPVNAHAEYRLPDSLLWDVLADRVLRELSSEMRFCEVDADTGGWSGRLVREYPGARGVALVDSRMAVAGVIGDQSHAHRGMERLKVYSVDSMPLSKFDQHSFDLTFSFSGLLAWSRYPESVVKELVRVTKPRGHIVSLVPNMHHAVSWNLTHSRIDEAERALSGRGTIGAETQELNLYTRESIEALMTRSGACPELTLGLPPCGAEGSAVDECEGEVLRDPSSLSVRRKILDIQKQLLTTSALRGTHLFSIARVPYCPTQWGQFWYVE
jgi:SAM-dependent methyltransferase